jgi:hypothetical protein
VHGKYASKETNKGDSKATEGYKKIKSGMAFVTHVLFYHYAFSDPNFAIMLIS